MKNYRIIVPMLLLALAFSTIITACTKPPDEELMAAEDAIKAAELAGADELSPKLLDKARYFLQEAKLLNEQGRYNDALKKAEFAVMRAQQAERNSSRLTEAGEREKVPEEPAPPAEGAEGEAPVEESAEPETTEGGQE